MTAREHNRAWRLTLIALAVVVIAVITMQAVVAAVVAT